MEKKDSIIRFLREHCIGFDRFSERWFVSYSTRRAYYYDLRDLVEHEFLCLSLVVYNITMRDLASFHQSFLVKEKVEHI